MTVTTTKDESVTDENAVNETTVTDDEPTKRAREPTYRVMRLGELPTAWVVLDDDVRAGSDRAAIEQVCGEQNIDPAGCTFWAPLCSSIRERRPQAQQQTVTTFTW